MLTRKILILFLFFNLPSIVISSPLEFSHLSVENGLSNNFIRSLYKDAWGYLWIGSSEGIDRYDGWEIKSYNNHFPSEISKINTIAEDSSHYLWIGSESGLFTWDRVSPTFQKITYPLLAQAKIKKILSHKGQLFVCTNNGLFVISDKIEQLTFHKDAMKEISAITDFIIEDDQLYITSPEAIIQYDYKSKSSIITSKNQLLSELPSSLLDFTCITKLKNTLYLGTHAGGVYSYNLDTKTFSLVKGFDNNIILSIEIYGNRLFVGTDANGLKVKDLDRRTNVRSYRTENAVYCILKDKNNVLWLGTYTGGVYASSLSEKAFQTVIFENNENFKKANIRSLYFTENEKLIGTRNGLYIIDKQNDIEHLSSDNSTLKSKVILTIFPFKNSILLGTYGNGLYNYSDRTHKAKPWLPQIFQSQSIYAFDKDRDDNLWITTLEGLHIVNGEKHTFFNSNNSELLSNQIYALKIDQLNRVWIGTMQGLSLYGLEKGELKLISDFPDSPKAKITHFYLSDDSHMWVSTENNGFLIYDENHREQNHFTQKEGLCHNSVSSIIKTEDNKYLISTLKGASLYNPLDNTFQNYNLTDGLPGLTFNSGAVLMNANKTIFLGNVNGIVEYKPNVDIIDTKAHIIITNIYVGGKELSDLQKQAIGKPIEEIKTFSIKGNNNVGFKVVNTAAQNSTNEGYLVKLERNKKPQEWEAIGSKGTVYYSNLAPGTHQFSAKLASSTSQEIKTITIRIKSDWFSNIYIIVILIVLISIIVFLYFKKRQPKKVANKDKYSNSLLSVDDGKTILNELKIYIEKEEVFLQPELKIRDIATATKYPIRSISQAINQNMNISFGDYINHFRVNEIKKRLDNPDNHHKFTLLAIAKNCGFNSKSSFYRAFKKETGQTPAEYWSNIKE